MKLHITNGDVAGEMLTLLFSKDDEILCWRDLLHDGPMPAGDYSLFVKARSGYLSELLAEDPEGPQLTAAAIAEDFIKRQGLFDSITDDQAKYDEIVLWFEHDLYDQLQLAEICFRLLQLDTNRLPVISIICIDNHPEVPVFHGLGNLTPPLLEELFPSRSTLTGYQLQAAADVWQVLLSDTPDRLAALVGSEVEGWPFMAEALRRFCCEYPALETGLTLTQTYILLALLKAPDELPALHLQLQQMERQGVLSDGENADQRYYSILTGPATFGRIFHHLQQLEVAPFMGDLSVRMELNRLCNAAVPYVAAIPGDKPVYRLTETGAKALMGQAHWRELNGYDLWRGGVHITDQQTWYWDQANKRFVKA
ncbi:DUF1835 domain-containing protein [Neptuniibacter sp.]|uniref:DUF1835 domain-containing protein n=1 Tax=Neptuniibacter sp. TaxID=1962643 RepID=UPI0026334CC2|nr:DUF1835 domain-containing protein [Neptuniibacter sp.]MCP4596998.1 DUF1835 domain-containing protein [Neptuniibacter sp.]